MSEQKISIVVPVYNTGKYLYKCLDSLICQTYKNIEIICVNDGSTDNSLDILKQFEKKDNRIVIVNKENSGLSGARNEGIKKATGEYIIFVDSDDWIDLSTCKVAIETMIKFDVDIVIWSYFSEYKTHKVEKKIFSNDRYFNKEQTKYELYRRMFGLVTNELRNPENNDALVTVWGKLYNAKLIKDEDIKFVDTKYIGSEDAYFNIQVFPNAKASYFINRPLNHYCKINTDSYTSVFKPQLFMQWKNLFTLMKKEIVDNSLECQFNVALSNRIALSIIGLGMNIQGMDASFFVKVKKIGMILKDSYICDALGKLELKYFDLKWRLFFLCARYRMSFFLQVLLMCINYLRRNSNKHEAVK